MGRSGCGSRIFKGGWNKSESAMFFEPGVSIGVLGGDVGGEGVGGFEGFGWGGVMYRCWMICLCMVLISFGSALAEEKAKQTDEETKELSGMSIVGNDEAPKSLYIVPWKSSQIGMETSLDSMLNEGERPVDRDVFMRQLEFYRVSTAK